MNLESLDVRESVSFISEFLDLKEGKWTAPKNKGDFSIDPSELSIFPMSSLNKGLHIIKLMMVLDLEIILHIIHQLQVILLLR